jgi:hypothetical protein
MSSTAFTNLSRRAYIERGADERFASHVVLRVEVRAHGMARLARAYLAAATRPLRALGDMTDSLPSFTHHSISKILRAWLRQRPRIT